MKNLIKTIILLILAILFNVQAESLGFRYISADKTEFFKEEQSCKAAEGSDSNERRACMGIWNDWVQTQEFVFKESALDKANRLLKETKSTAVIRCIVEVEGVATSNLGEEVDSTLGAYDPVMFDVVADNSTPQNPHFEWEVRFANGMFKVKRTGETFGAVCIFNPESNTAKINKFLTK